MAITPDDAVLVTDQNTLCTISSVVGTNVDKVWKSQAVINADGTVTCGGIRLGVIIGTFNNGWATPDGMAYLMVSVDEPYSYHPIAVLMLPHGSLRLAYASQAVNQTII